MPYGKQFDSIYRGTIDAAVHEIGLECLRADEIPAAGQALLDKVHRCISEAAVIIADVTGSNANVLYEVDYARALGKDVVLITQDSPTEVVSNLMGLELLVYSADRLGLEQLQQRLKVHLEALLRDTTGYLRDMLGPPDAGHCYILTSPRAGGFSSRFPERRAYGTYGDYLGVVGIMRAFGIMFGERRIPELLDSRLAREDVVHSNSVYIIGSFKANPFQEKYLQRIQQDRAPGWRFSRRPGDKRKDFEVVLAGDVDGRKWTWRDKTDLPFDEDPTDYGLLVRGPHPYAQGKMAMILAGPHSRGTGAACLAATDSTLVARIASKFSSLTPPYSLDDKSKAFWVLVKGDRPLSPDQVTIERVGVYP
jgi:hypothetical protein